MLATVFSAINRIIQVNFDRRDAKIRFLLTQIRIVMSRLLRIQTTPAERSELLAIGAELGHDVKGLLGIHLGSRKVWYSPTTMHPTKEWCCRQARNVQLWIEDEGINPRFLIRDGDKKYKPKFDQHWKDAGVQIKRTPPSTPQANGFAERWIGSI